MSASHPKAKGAHLPWALSPPWLRLVRVLFIAVWAMGFLCLTALFYLQYQVIWSPKAPTGEYIHAVHYKGTIHYLAEPLFSVWSSLDTAWMPLCAVGFSLGVVGGIYEDRILRRRWDGFLGKGAEQTGPPTSAN